MIETRLARTVKQFREANELTQFEFAEECGISEDLVSLIERQKANVTLSTLDLISVRMNVSVAELFMTTTLYFLIESDITIEDTTTKTYGIGVIKDYKLHDYILDISTNQEEIQNLVYDLNEYELDAVHFHEYIEDWIE